MDRITAMSIPLAVGGVVVYVLGTCAYNLWFHPLRHIPGPWYTAVSPLYITIKDMQFMKAHVVHDLLRQYGGIVRIEPNQVAFVDQESARIVYSTASKFPKSSWYKCLLTNENDHAMTTLEPAPHTIRKRAYAPHYVPNNLALYQPEMHEFANVLLEKMGQYDGKRSFDCLVLFRRYFADNIFVSSYGQRLSALKQWDIVNFSKDSASDIVQAVNLFPVRGVMRAAMPAPVWNLVSKIPVAGWQALIQSDNTVAAYVTNARDKVVASDPTFKLTGELDSDSTTDERLSLIHRLLRQSLRAKAEDKLSDKDIISEAMAHTIAGVDTSATLLSYMCYTLANRPDVVAKLRAEFDPLMPHDGEGGERKIPDIGVLNKLPYLTAFWKESLRLYGSGPSLLERVVPPTLDSPLVIKGYEIPVGSIVATQSWSTQRVPEVFPEPESFKPERWFDETDEMRAHQMPFGYGGRLCGGMNLAHISIRIALAAIVRNFDIVVPPETTTETMACRFAFVLLPAAQKACLVFKPRSN